ncbi:excinuclease ABC subunit UvrC [Moraxella sp. ZY210820]|uniref:excinuclease ABC subunit UvrC n=1 Tax=unclassified Moraxella TaxID=2685852 RepID=UPI002731EB23|nr:excinuclease ABC subunit UvrC [Moraxella sp. ZY210820]WLF83044.1 excinuclease ABC subunit UvrC [Moraxella sp. ZY210820]
MMNELSVHLKQILANLPKSAGVYKMLAENGDLLYVGKAKNLKNRVSSYFVKTIEHPKTQALVSRIADIELLLTRSETEALLLEQNLIKHHRPPYNIMLRDDKSYLYIFISADAPYPRIASGRGKGKHQVGKFFGPYPSAQKVKETLLLLQKLFYVRQCENSYFKQRKRPCLQYQIKRCSAPCVGLISAEDYAQDIQHSKDFLQGNMQSIQQDLIAKMEYSAEQLDFEQAVFYRDRLATLRDIQAQQAVYKMKGEADIFAIAYQAGVICVQILFVRYGQMLGGQHYFPDVPILLNDDGVPDLMQILTDFIIHFYFQVNDDIPSEIIIPFALDNQKQLTEILGEQANKKVEFKYRVKEFRADWQQLAQMNVEQAIKSQLSHHLELKQRFEALSAIVQRPIDRIECFDISHTMGEETVASCVVFDQSGARKRDYRQFNITDIQAGDDYSAMRQALTRRYKKHGLPDLLLIDGGKGQLHIAEQVMAELGLNAFMVGVSKGEGRKAGLESLHFTNGERVQLAEDHKALHLIQQIRDEAHRFAITKHRAKRDQKRGQSILEVIPNLGEKRRRDLLTHFAGLQGVLSASKQDLMQVNGIGEQLADTIYKVLHGD